jgi:polysaccharide export outer membrane protein
MLFSDAPAVNKVKPLLTGARMSPGRFALCLITYVILNMPAMVHAGDYVIGEGDRLDISVWGVKDLGFSVRVRPDGKITVPGLGDVVASGFVPMELQNDLTERLKVLVKSPIVTVTVGDITNSKVYLFGSGIKSGVYDLLRKTTLLQLLCIIGDVKSADLKRAYVLRKGKKVKENFKRLFTDGDISDDFDIVTNDAVFIPMLQDRSIYVMGAINTPKAIEYREGITVIEAILEAGGFTRFASQNDTIIVRKEDGKDTKIRVKAKDLLKDADLSQNVRLKPGDYIIAKESIF